MTDSEIYKRLAAVEEQCIKLHHSINELRKLVSSLEHESKRHVKLGPRNETRKEDSRSFLQEIDLMGR